MKENMEVIKYIIGIVVGTGILTGAITFFIKEIIIKPRIKVKDLMAEFSHKILLYQAQYTNANLDKEKVLEIKELTTKLIGNAWAYSLDRETRKTLLEIGREINYLTSPHNDDIKWDKIMESINNVKRSSKYIKTSYDIDYKKNWKEVIIKMILLLLLCGNIVLFIYVINSNKVMNQKVDTIEVSVKDLNNKILELEALKLKVDNSDQ